MRTSSVRLSPVLPWLILLGLLAGCGEPEPVPPAGPLTPDLYDIAADDVPAPGQFLRYAPPGPNGGGLDIAVTDYSHPDGLPDVSLVGAVHVADPLYFQHLQRLLDEAYDLVLYEAVKPAGVSVTAWQEQAEVHPSSAGAFQQEIASWFGFDFQLAALDYDRPHFVHADMTLEEFREAGGDAVLPSDEGRGPPELPEGIRGTLEAVRAFGKLAMSEPNPLRSLARKMFAETMGTTDIGTTLDMFPGLSELVLDRRNTVVMNKLVEVLPTTKGRIGILYGAAHMPDLEQRLVGEQGYERRGGRWLRAWALRKPLR